MGTEYTPAPETVKAIWLHDLYPEDKQRGSDEFDRMIAEVKAQALEGAAALAVDGVPHGYTAHEWLTARAEAARHREGNTP